LEFLQDKDNDIQTAVHSLEYNLYDMEQTLDHRCITECNNNTLANIMVMSLSMLRSTK